ncbi:diguanylate cyclase [Peribacillus glennii]|uniref:Diguanylate cyclase n=1 Tax=Peribacillus glennii TaxID=2303991 RepID=A0A372LCS3_9BACI|nr:diguanylate cyclase [Peribacillus glennii]RFU63754.1 diguanylate cyclase [Peribacillus glennii]
MYRKLGLQSKIILLFSAMIFVTMSAGIIFNIYTISDAVKKTYVSQLKGITTTINGRYEESRSIQDVQQIFDYIKQQEENVLALNLHVKKGERSTVLASSDRSIIGSATPDTLSPSLESGKTMISHLKEGEKQSVRLIAPLLEDGMIIGAIEIFIDETDDEALVQQRIEFMAIFSIIISVILFVLLWYIIRRLFVLPLMSLREAAVSIQQGKDYEEVQLNASREINELAAAFNEMVYNLEDRYVKSITDSLTGTYNSAYFKQKLSESMIQAKETGESMALLFCDIDNFKKLNDHEGHLFGDKVLKQISELILSNVGPDDTVCRYGGEEFVVIMPYTDGPAAKSKAEKLRHLVAIHGNQSVLTPITISIGIAVFPDDAEEENLVHTADQAMYTAKGHGKNRVVLASELKSFRKQNYVRKVDDQKWLLDTILSLAKAVEVKDPYTHNHSERVSKYAGAVASSMGLADEEVKNISIAGLLHDVGKIGIPDGILNKEGRLTNEEYEIMKSHPVLGYHILASVEELKETLPYVLYHHERPDGKGYPHGLTDGIPLGARIIAVADAFHSMTSARPYRKNALSEELAIEELKKGQGTQFDPVVVGQFLSVIKDIEKLSRPG